MMKRYLSWRTSCPDVRRWAPLTCAAFEDYRLHGAELSAKALAVLRRMLAGETVAQADSDLGAREWRELQALLGRH